MLTYTLLIALGKFFLGFLASPAAMATICSEKKRQVSFGARFSAKSLAAQTHLGSDVGEGSLVKNSPESEEASWRSVEGQREGSKLGRRSELTLGAGNVEVLNEDSGVVPVAESNARAVGVLLGIKDDTEDDEADDGDDLDDGEPWERKLRSADAPKGQQRGRKDDLQNSHSPYTFVPPKLMATATTRQIAIQTPGLMSFDQYPMRTAAAFSSAGSTIVQLYQ